MKHKKQNEKKDNQVSKKQSTSFNLKREIEKLPEPARSYYGGGFFTITYGGGTQEYKEKQYKQITKQVKAYIASQRQDQSGSLSSKGSIGQEIPRKVKDGVQSEGELHYIEAEFYRNTVTVIKQSKEFLDEFRRSWSSGNQTPSS